VSLFIIFTLAALAIYYSTRPAPVPKSAREYPNSPGVIGYVALAALVGPPALAVPLFFSAPLAALLLLAAWPVGVLIVFGVSALTAPKTRAPSPPAHSKMTTFD
jgi:hypothetical protein